MGYKIGKVYMIIKIDDPTVNYVGSTFSELKMRWWGHKQKNNNCSIKEYFDKYGIDKFKIILIKEYEVCADNQKDNKHLKAYEQLWINKFKLKNCCVNKVDALGLLRKNKISKYQKKYHEANKEELLKKHKQYRKVNKEKISEKRKEYCKINKEKIAEQRKEYREANKIKLSEKAKEKVECIICNSIVSRTHLSRHQKSIKCLTIKNNI